VLQSVLSRGPTLINIESNIIVLFGVTNRKTITYAEKNVGGHMATRRTTSLNRRRHCRCVPYLLFLAGAATAAGARVTTLALAAGRARRATLAGVAAAALLVGLAGRGSSTATSTARHVRGCRKLTTIKNCSDKNARSVVV